VLYSAIIIINEVKVINMQTQILPRNSSISSKNLRKKIISFKFGELFCGPGGLALGAVSVKCETKNNIYKISHTWANDHDIYSCKTYRRNICPDNPDSVICEDIRKLNIENLPSINAFAYGFPCNDFSIVGEQKGFHGEYK
jgi:DNA (cytosine-5)-methyltransferase 1